MTAQQPESGPKPNGEGVFSLDDLDKIIEAEDPEFKKKMGDIKSQAVEVNESLANLSIESSVETATEEESETTSGQRLRSLFLKPWRRLLGYFRFRLTALKNRIIILKDWLKDFFREGLPKMIRTLRLHLITTKDYISFLLKEFKGLNRSQKWGILIMTVTAVSSTFFLSKTFTGHWLPQFEEGLVHSLGERSVVGQALSKEDYQDLFQAFPEVEYHILLKKLIVNLKNEENSGKNPMGAFEIFVGVDSQDTAIEIKDRENELMDLIQRTIEEFTYAEATTIVGKMRMKAAVRDRLNEVINQGKVFNVYYNTFIIYE